MYPCLIIVFCTVLINVLLFQAIKTTQESIKDAVSFIIRILENRTLIAKNNQFELVIATYALILVDARISRALLRQIERYSSRKGIYLYSFKLSSTIVSICFERVYAIKVKLYTEFVVTFVLNLN